MASASSSTKISNPRSTALKRLLNQNSGNNNITTINDLFNDNKNNNTKRHKLSINDNESLSYSSQSQSNNEEEEEEEIEAEEEYYENEQQQQPKEEESIKESIKSIENNQKLLMLKMDLIIETFKYFQSNFISKTKFKNCMKNVIFNNNNNNNTDNVRERERETL